MKNKGKTYQSPTLKVYEYRGVKIYIRRLFRETFEYLIGWNGEIFCNQIEIQKQTGQRFRDYEEKELETALTLMQRTAELFVDDQLFKLEEYHRFPNRVKRLIQRSLGLIKFIHYKLQIIYDGIQAKIIYARRRRARHAESKTIVDGIDGGQ